MKEEVKKKIILAIAFIAVIFEIALIFVLAQPTINFVGDYPDPVEVPGYNNITTNVTNATAVYVEIYYPNVTALGNFSMNKIGGAYVYGSYYWYYNRSYSYPDPLGTYTYYIKARNWTGWVVNGPYTITVQDTTPPSSSIQHVSYWQNSAVLLTVTATDNYAVANVSLFYRYSTDNATWSSWKFYAKDTNSTDGWSFSFNFPDGEGYYEFYSIANDTAGNTETKTTADEIAGYDATYPTTSYTITPLSPDGKNGWYVSAVNITLTSSDELSGVASIKYRIDGGSWKEYTSSFTVSKDGEHLVEYYAIDKAGNAEDVKNFTIKVDTSKPEAYLQRPLPGYLYLFDRQIWRLASGNTVIIGRIIVRVVAYDLHSGIENVSFYVDGNLQNIDVTSPYEWIWRGDIGWKYLYAVAYNKAGLRQETMVLPVFIFSL